VTGTGVSNAATAIDRLTALDRLMLGASRRWPQHIGALATLDAAPLLDPDGTVRIGAVRRAIASRLHLFGRLRQVVHTPGPGRGGPVWVDAARFDIADHVSEAPHPAWTDEPGLLRVAEELRREPFDTAKPLWRMWLLPAADRERVALVVWVHHAIADGTAAMAMLAALLDTETDTDTGTPDPLPWTPRTPPSDRDLVVDAVQRRRRGLRRAAATMARPRSALRRARRAWPALREVLAEKPGTRTGLDRMVGADRRLAVIRLALDDVTRVAHTHDATVNDVLLALTSAGLRAVLRERGEPTETITLRTYVPVSLRPPSGAGTAGNLIAQMAVPLPMRAARPADELRRIAGETAARKARARTSLGTLVRGRFTRRIMLFAVTRGRVNVTTASIRGPADPIELCGARVLDVVPILPLIADEPLGVGGLSYAGQFVLGIVVDPHVYPDLPAFVDGGCELLRALGVRPQRVSTAPAGTSTGG
jgi:WS/DGAT/MGAT family acyltransferase